MAIMIMGGYLEDIGCILADLLVWVLIRDWLSDGHCVQLEYYEKIGSELHG